MKLTHVYGEQVDMRWKSSIGDEWLRVGKKIYLTKGHFISLWDKGGQKTVCWVHMSVVQNLGKDLFS